MRRLWLTILAALAVFVGVPQGSAQEFAPRSYGPVGQSIVLPVLPTKSQSATLGMPIASGASPTYMTLPTSTPSFVGGTQPGLAAPVHDPHPVARPTQSSPDDVFTPYMLGDFTGPIGSLFSDLKVAEGNSPRPVDRFFANFNYYNNLYADHLADPAQSIRRADLYRYVIGFEKTLMDQKLSVTVRVPFFSIDADSRDFIVTPNGLAPAEQGLSRSALGNLSAIAKGVVIEDKQSGSLLSVGTVVSLPTAGSRLIDPGIGTLAFLQPFAGYIYQKGDLFVQGFTGITLPLARPESILLFEDIGVGYFVYRCQGETGSVRSIAPMLEMHVMLPLRQADPYQDLYGVTDSLRLHSLVDFTLGVSVDFMNHTTLGVGACMPITGPQPFDVEAIAQFNWRF